MEITAEHTQSLVDKLNSLDLTAEEREVLGQLLSHSDNETEGFRDRDYLTNAGAVHGFNIGMPPTRGFNIGMPPPKGFNIGMPPPDGFNIGMPPTKG